MREGCVEERECMLTIESLVEDDKREEKREE